jgi:adenosylcobinamide-GDP ribazoletransferase
VKRPPFLRRFRVALAFLTRLPGGRHPEGEGELAASLAAFPLVGAVLGALLAAVLAAAAAVLPDAIAAVLATALLAAATGGLHLDGLADTFDALGSGGGPARRLEVMRDSRIGAHGAAAVALVLIAKTACLEQVAAAGPLALIGALATARWLAALAIAIYPYARREGLGRSFAEVRAADLAVATATVAVVAVAVPAPAGVVAVLAASAAAFALWTWLAGSLGGLTGDGYGAGIEIAEVASLCAAAAAC